MLYNFYKCFQIIKVYKNLSLFFMLLLFSQLNVACNNLFSNRVTLGLLVQQSDVENWRPLIETFESRHQDIGIELINDKGINPTNTDGVREEYIKLFEEESFPVDLVFIDIIWLPEYAENNWLVPLDEDFADLDSNSFLDYEVQNGKYNNRLYRIPFRSDVGILFYRKDLLRSLNTSRIKTFNELLQISQKLQSQKKATVGFLWQGRNYEGLSAMFLEILKGHGGFWINEENNEVGLNRSEAFEAVRFLKKTIETGVSSEKGDSSQAILSYQEDITRNTFRQGKAVFMRNWPKVWVDVNRSDSQVLGKVGVQEMVHIKGQKSSATIGGWGLGIAKNSKHKSQAVEAIKFFTSAEIQRKFALKAGYVPTKKSLFSDPEIVRQYNYFPKLKNIIETNGVKRPRMTKYSKASSILRDCLIRALRGEMDIAAAMKTATNDTNKLLSSDSVPETSCDL